MKKEIIIVSVEDIMKPRIMVIAEYPDMLYRVGDIFYDSNTGYYDKYPACFKVLQWHEHRTDNWAPKYLKHNKWGIVYKITMHEEGYWYYKGKDYSLLQYWGSCTPITKDEYDKLID